MQSDDFGQTGESWQFFKDQEELRYPGVLRGFEILVASVPCFGVRIMQFGWKWPLVLAFAVAGVVSNPLAYAGDWSRFRGPNGSGVSTDKEPLPAQWSETENLQWKTQAPRTGQFLPHRGG